MSEWLTGLFWWFLIFSVLFPMIRQRIIEASRVAVMRALEQQRGSRVITMIHRQEALTLGRERGGGGPGADRRTLDPRA